MSAVDNSGAAFPTQAHSKMEPVPGTGGSRQVTIPPQDGMSLRDYFAAAAVTGLIARHNGAVDYETFSQVANYAYNIADNMLFVRKQPKP